MMIYYIAPYSNYFIFGRFNIYYALCLICFIKAMQNELLSSSRNNPQALTWCKIVENSTYCFLVTDLIWIWKWSIRFMEFSSLAYQILPNYPCSFFFIKHPFPCFLHSFCITNDFTNHNWPGACHAPYAIIIDLFPVSAQFFFWQVLNIKWIILFD